MSRQVAMKKKYFTQNWLNAALNETLSHIKADHPLAGAGGPGPLGHCYVLSIAREQSPASSCAVGLSIQAADSGHTEMPPEGHRQAEQHRSPSELNAL